MQFVYAFALLALTAGTAYAQPRSLKQSMGSCSGIRLVYTQMSSGASSTSLSGTVRLINDNPFPWAFSQPTLQLTPAGGSVTPEYQPLICLQSSGTLYPYISIDCTFQVLSPGSFSSMAPFVVPAAIGNDQVNKCFGRVVSINGGSASLGWTDRSWTDGSGASSQASASSSGGSSVVQSTVSASDGSEVAKSADSSSGGSSFMQFTASSSGGSEMEQYAVQYASNSEDMQAIVSASGDSSFAQATTSSRGSSSFASSSSSGGRSSARSTAAFQSRN